MRYEVVDKAGEVINVIMWDGVSPFDAGEGNTLRPAPLSDPPPQPPIGSQ